MGDIVLRVSAFPNLEGVLCLELSHCEEGQGRKWLKTKGRSDVKQIVRVSKEVSIPCSPLPPNQLMISHPPNGLSSLHDNCKFN